MEKGRRKIALVDDVLTNLQIGQKILSPYYEVYTAPSGTVLFRILERITPDLILLDIDMPGMNGYEVLERLKGAEKTRDIPVVFLSGNSGPLFEEKGLSLGAVDYMIKPYSPQLLLKRVELWFRLDAQERAIRTYEEKLRQAEREKTQTLAKIQNNVLKTVIELVGRRDEVVGGHAERTRQFVGVLLDTLLHNGLYHEVIQSWEKELLLQSTLLYDLGKVSIDDRILLKPGKLTREEFAAIQKHTLMGVRILEDIEAGLDKNAAGTSFLDHAKAFAGSHHERWDGSGYPYGLKGYNIPLQGRIIALADVYSALIAERPYSKAATHEEALSIIAQGREAQFDPALVDLFLSTAEMFRFISQTPAPPLPPLSGQPG
jgi:putative two-component system response regulator